MTEQWPTLPPARPTPTTPTAPERPAGLRRSRRQRVLGGVCGGLAEYLNLDPVIVRLITVALMLAGVGFLAYVVAWIAIPEAENEAPAAPAPAGARRRAIGVLGVVLIVTGAVLVVRASAPFLHLGMMWPASLHLGMMWPFVVVAIGVAVVALGRR